MVHDLLLVACKPRDTLLARTALLVLESGATRTLIIVPDSLLLLGLQMDARVLQEVIHVDVA